MVGSNMLSIKDFPFLSQGTIAPHGKRILDQVHKKKNILIFRFCQKPIFAFMNLWSDNSTYALQHTVIWFPATVSLSIDGAV